LVAKDCNSLGIASGCVAAIGRSLRDTADENRGRLGCVTNLDSGRFDGIPHGNGLGIGLIRGCITAIGRSLRDTADENRGWLGCIADLDSGRFDSIPHGNGLGIGLIRGSVIARRRASVSGCLGGVADDNRAGSAIVAQNYRTRRITSDLDNLLGWLIGNGIIGGNRITGVNCGLRGIVRIRTLAGRLANGAVLGGSRTAGVAQTLG